MMKLNKEAIIELFLYLVFGVLTTVISIASYMILRHLRLNILFSNIISWILSVAFAFITNKLYVFKAFNISIKAITREAFSFLYSRIGTLLLECLILYIGIKLFNINELITKLFAQIIVIVSNYVLSKFFIFKK